MKANLSQGVVFSGSQKVDRVLVIYVNPNRRIFVIDKQVTLIVRKISFVQLTLFVCTFCLTETL